jgi:hypothetical protein
VQAGRPRDPPWASKRSQRRSVGGGVLKRRIALATAQALVLRDVAEPLSRRAGAVIRAGRAEPVTVARRACLHRATLGWNAARTTRKRIEVERARRLARRGVSPSALRVVTTRDTFWVAGWSRSFVTEVLRVRMGRPSRAPGTRAIDSRIRTGATFEHRCRSAFYRSRRRVSETCSEAQEAAD